MSLNIALSGINAINGQLNEISNNIANTGTVGFKAGRANFASVYLQGTGAGVYVGSVTQSMSRTGNMLATGRGLDAGIQGRGFFVSRGTDGSMQYMRAGSFNTSKDGFLIDAFGRRVQGYPEGGGGTTGDIEIPTGGIGAKPSSEMAFNATLSADWTTPSVTPFDPAVAGSYNAMRATVVYDSLGREHMVSQYFVKGAGNAVTTYYAMDGAVVGAPTTMTFDTNGVMTAPTAAVAVPLGTPTGASAMNINIDYTGTSMAAGNLSVSTNRADGNAPGVLTDVSLDETGSVVLQYSNGVREPIAQLAMATFPNENALIPVDGSAWVMSGESGGPIYNIAGTGLVGKLAVKNLEQSNVDITGELISLMSAQQNYQANSKVISTENDMVRNLMQAV